MASAPSFATDMSIQRNAFDFHFGNRPDLVWQQLRAPAPAPATTAPRHHQPPSPPSPRYNRQTLRDKALIGTAEEELPSLIPLFLPFTPVQAQSGTGELAVPEALSLSLMAFPPP